MRRKTSDIEWYGIALAIILALSIPWSLFQIYQDSHARQNAEATESQREGWQEVFELCQQKPGALAADCLAQAHEAYPKDKRGEYDLEAQQDMAEWAAFAWFVSVLGTIASFFALAGVFITLRDQREQFAAERRPWVHFRNVRVESVVVGPPFPGLHTTGDRSLRIRISYECVHTGASPALYFTAQLVGDTARMTEESYPIRTVRRHHAFHVGRRSGRLFSVGEIEHRTDESILNFTAPTNRKAFATITVFFSLVATYRSTIPGLGTLETIQSFAIHQLHRGGDTRFALNFWDLTNDPPPTEPIRLVVDPGGYTNVQ